MGGESSGVLGESPQPGRLIEHAGALLVLCRGEWRQLLAMHLVPGDVYMIAATISWSVYSWLLMRPKAPQEIGAIVLSSRH